MVDEIFHYARLDKYYKESCIERRLRELTNEGKIEPIKKGSYIIAYKPTLPLNTSPRAKSGEIQDLDERLKTILNAIKPTWDNIHQIKEIEKAIKSKYNTTKVMVVQKYGNTKI